MPYSEIDNDAWFDETQKRSFDMNTLTHEQIDLAVNWWTDRIISPKFNHVTNDELKNQPAQAVAISLADSLKRPVDDSIADKFREALRGQLIAHNPSYISVDYGPDSILWAAGQEAGVPRNNYPWKTKMILRDGGVEASVGYGAELVKVEA